MAAAGLLPEAEDLLATLERRLASSGGGLGVADGYNPRLRFMQHLWEPLKHCYR